MDQRIENLQALIQLKELEIRLLEMLADASWVNCHATIKVELNDNRVNQAILGDANAHHRLNENLSENEGA